MTTLTHMVKVGIIEDEKNIREGLASFLEAHHDIDFLFDAESAEEGLAKLEFGSQKPDVLILDIGLPGASGIESLPKIKSLVPDMDVIMFSSYGEEDKIFGALCAGACSYISKGTSLSAIVESIIIVSKGGSYMSPSIARKIANQFVPKNQKSFNLSTRQKEILDCLVKGMSYKMVAAELFISLDTVRFHIKNIYKEMEVNSKIEALNKYVGK